MALLTQTPATSTGGTSSTPIVPDWYAQAQQTIAGQGAALAGQDYQTYQGPTIAALTPDQTNAMQMTQNIASGSQPDPSQVQGNINYGLSQFDPNEVSKYMSPYTSGVVDEIARLGNKNLMQNVLPGVNSTFTGAGQFGSTRNANFENNAIQDNNYNILGQQANALQTAEAGALSNYSQWHQNALTNAGNANNIAQTSANNLGQAGALQQAQDQNNLNAAKADFTAQTNYPQQQLNWYSSLVQGNTPAAASSGTTTSTAYMPSGLQTAAAVYGLMNGVTKTAP